MKGEGGEGRGGEGRREEGEGEGRREEGEGEEGRGGEGRGRGRGEVNHDHCQPTGGPLSDVLLEREKQRRTSDKKHSPEKHKVSLIPKPRSSHTYTCTAITHSLILKFSPLHIQYRSIKSLRSVFIERSTERNS